MGVLPFILVSRLGVRYYSDIEFRGTYKERLELTYAKNLADYLQLVVL